MCYKLCIPAAAVAILNFGNALAQDSRALTEWYGNGVHAYFSGDDVRAERQLTRSIDAGTTDPRTYYFRALVFLRTGNTTEADADMAKGAALEVQDLDGTYPVNRSLQRVQGRHRQILEGSRRQAQAVAYRQQQEYLRKRYETMRRRDAIVLRRPVDIRLDSFAPASFDLLAVKAPEGGHQRVERVVTSTTVPHDKDTKKNTKGNVLSRAMNKASGLTRLIGKALGASLPFPQKSDEKLDPFGDDLPEGVVEEPGPDEDPFDSLEEQDLEDPFSDESDEPMDEDPFSDE